MPACQFLAPQVERLEELHGGVHAGEVFALQVQFPTRGGSHGEENGLETVGKEPVEGHVPPQRRAAPKRDVVVIEERVHLLPRDAAGKAVGGDATDEHASRLGVGLENRDAVSEHREVVRCGKARGPGAHDGDLVRAFRASCDRRRLVGRGADAVGDEPLQGPDRHGFVAAGPELASLLALAVADAGTDRRKRVGPANDLVGFFVHALLDECHVAPRLGVQRAGGLAGRADQFRADEGVARLVHDVAFVLAAEVAQGAQDGIRRRLPQAAHRRVLHGERQLLQEVQVPGRGLAL